MKLFFAAAALAALCVPAGHASAQELKAERATDSRFYWVEMIKFHAGKRSRAGEILDKYFEPIDKELGLQVIDVHMNTGEWDNITLFAMPGGPADMTWRTSPQEVQFMNALAKRAGSMAEATKITDEWDTLIARREVHVAHMHP